MVSLILNIVLAVLVLMAVAMHCRKHPPSMVMRFFTAQSNVFCAVSALLVAAFRISGAVPQWVLILKYVGTAAVTVTFLTVFLFLVPFLTGLKRALSGPDFWLHLVCPLLAIVSYVGWDQPEAPFWVVILGMLPVLLYACLYLHKVIAAPEEKRWDDYYSFNRNGKWPVSFAAMTFASFVISVVLWAV